MSTFSILGITRGIRLHSKLQQKAYRFGSKRPFHSRGSHIAAHSDMLIGYMRVSKTNGSQVLDLQRDALLPANVLPERLITVGIRG